MEIKNQSCFYLVFQEPSLGILRNYRKDLLDESIVLILNIRSSIFLLLVSVLLIQFYGLDQTIRQNFRVSSHDISFISE